VDQGRVVFAVCESGPYRFVGDLVEEHRASWFPWGYRVRQVSGPARERVASGTMVELWQVDDVRLPVTAKPLILARIDYVARTNDYLAVTLQRVRGQPSASEASVVDSVRDGLLVFTIEERLGAATR
jgi:hypothetical protein